MVNVGRVIAELEPEDREGDAVALKVPEGHGKGADGFNNAKNTVCVEDEFPVHEAVLLGLAWGTEEDVGFGFLVGEDCRGRAVCEATDWIELVS